MQILSEDSFGIFIKKWRIFWSLLELKSKTATKVVYIYILLHNVIIDIDSMERIKNLLANEVNHYYKS